MFYRYFRGRGRRLPADDGAGRRAPGAAPAALHRARAATAHELPPPAPRGTGDQPDPVHRRAAGDPDLPDAVDDLLALHRAAGHPAQRPTPRSCVERPGEIIVAVSGDGRYSVRRRSWSTAAASNS